MRARNIKPSIFKNELLAVADPIHTVTFAGLWCAADREGRIEDRPAKIHMDVNPGRAFENSTEPSLAWLTENGFIRRYVIDGTRYIQVIKFAKHQNPHHKEPPSDIPEESKAQGCSVMHEGETPGFVAMNGHSIDHKPSKGTSSPPVHEGKTRLIPDSGFLIPDSPSLIPDSGSLIPDPRPLDGGEARSAPKPKSNGRHGTRIPEDFTLTAERRAYALSKLVDAEPTFEAFVAYWRSKARDNTKLDWDATWHSWVLKDAKDTKQHNAPRKTRYDQAMEHLDGK